MRILGLQIDRFGVWTNVAIENLREGVTVFYGPNEAGKTTLLQFIRTMLYGFGTEYSQRFVAAGSQHRGFLDAGCRVGGSLSLAARDDEYHVRRNASLTNHEDPLGDLRVTSRDGSRQGAYRLTTLLSGIDEELFNKVFAVGLRELQFLGTLNDTQAARYLYNLSTGTDRVSLVDVMRQLQLSRSRLVGVDGNDSLIGQVLTQRQQKLAEIERLGSQADRWAQLRGDIERMDEDIARLETSKQAILRRSRFTEQALRGQPDWERRRKLAVEIEALGEVTNVSPEKLAKIDELKQELASHEQRLASIRDKRTDLRDRAAKLGLNDNLRRHSIRIETLLESHGTLVGLDDQLQEVINQLEETEFEIHAEQERLGIIAEDARGIIPRFDATTFAALREPGRRVEREREALDAAKKEASKHKADADEIRRQLAESLGEEPDWFTASDRQDVLAAVEKTGELTTGLRRRVELEQFLASLRQRLKANGERSRQLLRNQLLPWEVVKALGVLFSAGAMLLLFAIFGEAFGLTQQSRTGFGVMGAVGVLLATILKFALDGSSRDELHACHQDQERLEKELADTEQQLEEIEKKLPGNRSGPVRLDEAKSRLGRLESLMPLESRRRRSDELAKQSEQRAIQLAHRLKDARQQWTEALHSLGLSTKLSPQQVSELAGESGNLSQLHRRWEHLTERREQTDRELSVFRDRLHDLLAELGLVPASERVLDQLSQLKQAAVQQQALEKTRFDLQGKDQVLRREQQQMERARQQAEVRRVSLLASTGAIDDDDLRIILEKRVRREELQRERADADRQIRQLFGEEFDEDALAREIHQSGEMTLAERVAAGQAELERIESRLKELLLRRGEMAEQLRSLLADRQLGTAHLEVGVLDHSLAESVSHWKTLSTISTLLRHVYKRYEKDRQPETLQSASLHFRRMTSGRYLRIWTPLDEDVLIVDDASGGSTSVDRLSRGTREQVFLALRLALIAGYAGRGVRMPVVLDDVLVNFDEQRTQAAAEVLLDFAHAGHQLLVFTCHRHVMDIFGQLAADVRTLPTHQGTVVAEEFESASSARPVASVPTMPAVQSRRQSRQAARPKKQRRTAAFVIGYEDEADWYQSPSTEATSLAADKVDEQQLVGAGVHSALNAEAESWRPVAAPDLAPARSASGPNAWQPLMEPFDADGPSNHANDSSPSWRTASDTPGPATWAEPPLTNDPPPDLPQDEPQVPDARLVEGDTPMELDGGQHQDPATPQDDHGDDPRSQNQPFNVVDHHQQAVGTDDNQHLSVDDTTLFHADDDRLDTNENLDGAAAHEAVDDVTTDDLVKSIVSGSESRRKKAAGVDPASSPGDQASDCSEEIVVTDSDDDDSDEDKDADVEYEYEYEYVDDGMDDLADAETDDVMEADEDEELGDEDDDDEDDDDEVDDEIREMSNELEDSLGDEEETDSDEGPEQIGDTRMEEQGLPREDAGENDDEIEYEYEYVDEDEYEDEDNDEDEDEEQT